MSDVAYCTNRTSHTGLALSVVRRTPEGTFRALQGRFWPGTELAWRSGRCYRTADSTSNAGLPSDELFRLATDALRGQREVNIAYQVMGDGPLDLIMIPGIVSHIEFLHEMPGYTAFLRRLSKFARVITFDKRGQGLSDRVSGAPSLEERMDDVRAVMDNIGSRRAALLGFSEGCALSAMFAASYPERVSHLVLFGGFIRYAELFSAGDPEQIIP